MKENKNKLCSSKKLWILSTWNGVAFFFFNYIYAFFSCDDISSFKESVHFVHIGLVPKE